MYLDDPEAFTKEIRALYQELFSMYDTNMDCLLDGRELVTAFQENNRTNKVADMSYFSSFKEPNGIPASEIVEAWVQFHTNKTEENLTLITQL